MIILRFKTIRRIFFLIFILVLIGLVCILGINYYVTKIGKSYIVSKESIQKSKAAIILGAYVSPQGQLCDMLVDRVETGVELYKEGKVDKLLMTGDHGRKNYDEVNAMRKYAEARGIPTEDIFMDHAGFSTYESMYRVRDIFEIKDAVIITQRFHLPRAMYLAKKIGLNAYGVEADRHVYAGAEIYALREIPARVKAFFEADITHAKPTFLGDKISIDGDGRATWDGK